MAFPTLIVLVQQAIVGFIQLLLAVILSAGALHFGFGVFDKLTSGIDEWKEIKKGNLAVAIFCVAVLMSITMFVAPQIQVLVLTGGTIGTMLSSYYPSGTAGILVPLLLGLLAYLVSLVAGIVIVYLSVNLLDRLTPDLDEIAELKKGNLAVALILSVLLVCISYVASGVFNQLIYQLGLTGMYLFS